MCWLESLLVYVKMSEMAMERVGIALAQEEQDHFVILAASAVDCVEDS